MEKISYQIKQAQELLNQANKDLQSCQKKLKNALKHNLRQIALEKIAEKKKIESKISVLEKISLGLELKVQEEDLFSEFNDDPMLIKLIGTLDHK